MALTTAGARLTAAHRRNQAALRAAFTAEFLTAWRVLDPFRLDATTGAWLSVVTLLVGQWRATSARNAARYYTAHRAAELAARNRRPEAEHRRPVVPVPRTRAEPEAVRTSLLVTGPVTIKRLTGHGVPVPAATQTAAARAENAAARHVLDGGRDTVRHTAAVDPVALGWTRVTDGDPCWFCAMLASRGPAYKTRESALYVDGQDGQTFHDGCGCTVEPVYSRRADWPGDARKFQQLWRDVAEGLPAGEARRQFRRAVEAQSGTGAGSAAP